MAETNELEGQKRTIEYESLNEFEPIDGKCVSCGGQLESGFVIDRDSSGTGIQPMTWIGGELIKRWLLGYGIPKGAISYHVQAARCGKCGRLELFAMKQVR